jgi:hypothetical protein
MFNNCVKVLDTENRKTKEDENGKVTKNSTKQALMV